MTFYIKIGVSSLVVSAIVGGVLYGMNHTAKMAAQEVKLAACHEYWSDEQMEERISKVKIGSYLCNLAGMARDQGYGETVVTGIRPEGMTYDECLAKEIKRLASLYPEPNCEFDDPVLTAKFSVKTIKRRRER